MNNVMKIMTRKSHGHLKGIKKAFNIQIQIQIQIQEQQEQQENKRQDGG